MAATIKNLIREADFQRLSVAESGPIVIAGGITDTIDGFGVVCLKIAGSVKSNRMVLVVHYRDVVKRPRRTGFSFCPCRLPESTRIAPGGDTRVESGESGAASMGGEKPDSTPPSVCLWNLTRNPLGFLIQSLSIILSPSAIFIGSPQLVSSSVMPGFLI